MAARKRFAQPTPVREGLSELLQLEPASAVLLPPLYGRPGSTPSPRLFSTLLSLSRPVSPAHDAISRPATSIPAQYPPRASSDPAPTVESQGFVLYLTSLVLWIVFLFWSFATDDFLHSIGVEWYPSREWALLVSAWSVMLAAFVYTTYIAINLFITPDLESLRSLTDTQAYILDPSHNPNEPHPLLFNSICLPPDAVPVLHDIPIGLHNRVVFGDFRRKGNLS